MFVPTLCFSFTKLIHKISQQLHKVIVILLYIFFIEKFKMKRIFRPKQQQLCISSKPNQSLCKNANFWKIKEFCFVCSTKIFLAYDDVTSKYIRMCSDMEKIETKRRRRKKPEINIFTSFPKKSRFVSVKQKK